MTGKPIVERESCIGSEWRADRLLSTVFCFGAAWVHEAHSSNLAPFLECAVHACFTCKTHTVTLSNRALKRSRQVIKQCYSFLISTRHVRRQSDVIQVTNLNDCLLFLITAPVMVNFSSSTFVTVRSKLSLYSAVQATTYFVLPHTHHPFPQRPPPPISGGGRITKQEGRYSTLSMCLFVEPTTGKQTKLINFQEVWIFVGKDSAETLTCLAKHKKKPLYSSSKRSLTVVKCVTV